ncbi:TM2 domain-containing protein [Streptomyces tagetis]|uniref:TM2 domain-containing protein n=1 Tax=Streptomyces tagetis TaxID=2820809 RepID=A0A940XPR7_9ACTN|nr:TM2 domain-containing protein [Streptomyces sp. RG38]MBQ0828554.1 TM2 domain-containing protein [Streptomyces sp. RG38]
MSEQPQQPSQPPGYGYPQQPPGAAGPYGYPPAGPPQGGPQQPGYQTPPGGYPQPPGGHQMPGYPPPPVYYPPDPSAPYGYDPYGRPYSDKSKIVAGILQLFLGSFGIGRFYVGSVGIGLAQLFTCGGLGFWSLIDGIMYLVDNDRTDSYGRVLRG